jgi:ABC transporter with metal-binding/Fe-S-binding domain ATP-binding protein
MKLGVLFSGGKDSCFSAYKAKQDGHELVCLISIISENPDSYMFHTPNITLTEKQAEVMNLPLLIHKTPGQKEKELKDLEQAMKTAIDKYDVQGIVTGALHSEYQASRIKKLCEKLGLQCINPLWRMDEIKYLKELVESKFKAMVVGVAAYPLDQTWLDRIINDKFIEDVKDLKDEYKIHPAGEGGEFETFVVNCPLFSRELKVVKRNTDGKGNSWKLNIKVE